MNVKEYLYSENLSIHSIGLITKEKAEYLYRDLDLEPMLDSQRKAVVVEPDQTCENLDRVVDTEATLMVNALCCARELEKFAAEQLGWEAQ